MRTAVGVDDLKGGHGIEAAAGDEEGGKIPCRGQRAVEYGYLATGHGEGGVGGIEGAVLDHELNVGLGVRVGRIVHDTPRANAPKMVKWAIFSRIRTKEIGEKQLVF